ncbi:unnamed protein product [Closterium sp. NIES-53]
MAPTAAPTLAVAAAAHEEEEEEARRRSDGTTQQVAGEWWQQEAAPTAAAAAPATPAAAAPPRASAPPRVGDVGWAVLDRYGPWPSVVVVVEQREDSVQPHVEVRPCALEHEKNHCISRIYPWTTYYQSHFESIYEHEHAKLRHAKKEAQSIFDSRLVGQRSVEGAATEVEEGKQQKGAEGRHQESGEACPQEGGEVHQQGVEQGGGGVESEACRVEEQESARKEVEDATMEEVSSSFLPPCHIHSMSHPVQFSPSLHLSLPTLPPCLQQEVGEARPQEGGEGHQQGVEEGGGGVESEACRVEERESARKEVEDATMEEVTTSAGVGCGIGPRCGTSSLGMPASIAGAPPSPGSTPTSLAASFEEVATPTSTPRPPPSHITVGATASSAAPTASTSHTTSSINPTAFISRTTASIAGATASHIPAPLAAATAATSIPRPPSSRVAANAIALPGARFGPTAATIRKRARDAAAAAAADGGGGGGAAAAATFRRPASSSRAIGATAQPVAPVDVTAETERVGAQRQMRGRGDGRGWAKKPQINWK